MKKLIFSILFLSFAFFSFGQVDTLNTAVTGAEFFQVNAAVLAGVLISLYEIVIRVYPTAKNYSILSLLISFLKFAIPNRSTTEKNYE
jgi:hypothetical protein